MIQVTVTGPISVADITAAERILKTLSTISGEGQTTTETTGKRGKKAQETVDLGFDETEEDEEETDDAEEEESETEYELSDVISAFKTYAKENTREKAGKILKKLGVKSLTDLKPAQYEKAMSLVA
jgi:hypothetical protein